MSVVADQLPVSVESKSSAPSVGRRRDDGGCLGGAEVARHGRLQPDLLERLFALDDLARRSAIQDVQRRFAGLDHVAIG